MTKSVTKSIGRNYHSKSYKNLKRNEMTSVITIKRSVSSGRSR